MTPTDDTRATLARLIQANPRVTVAELVTRAGVTRQRIHQLLEAMGYELDCRWRKAKSAKPPA